MNLKEQLKQDMKDAMRAKEIVKRDTIRSINTMIKQIEVDQRIDLDDNAVITLIQKGIKQREDAITQYLEAKRDDLVQVEQEQIDIFKLYLPKQLTDLFIPNSNIHSHDTRHRYDPHIRQRNTDKSSRYFIHKAPDIWYNLPQEMKQLKNINALTNKLKNYMIY